jgi:hypothetical protein
LNELSGIAASDAVCASATVWSRVALFANAMLAGTVEMMWVSMRDAAVAIAASPEALAEKRLVRRYGR